MTRSILDAATVLRDAAAAAVTASTDETGVAFDFLAHFHYLNQNSIANDDGGFKAVFHNVVSTGAPTSVTFVLDVAAAANMSGSKEVRRRLLNSGETRFEMDLSFVEIRQLLSTAAAMRCGVEIVGGTSPTLTYGCFLTKR